MRDCCLYCRLDVPSKAETPAQAKEEVEAITPPEETMERMKLPKNDALHNSTLSHDKPIS